jgi:hypothetical protein
VLLAAEMRRSPTTSWALLIPTRGRRRGSILAGEAAAGYYYYYGEGCASYLLVHAMSNQERVRIVGN